MFLAAAGRIGTALPGRDPVRSGPRGNIGHCGAGVCRHPGDPPGLLRIASYYHRHRRQNGALELDYDALARLKGTLIFLMAVATVGEIAAGLCGAGMEKDTPCALIENGTRPEQRKLLSTLEAVAEDALREKIQSPAVFVVGGVCGLSDAF